MDAVGSTEFPILDFRLLSSRTVVFKVFFTFLPYKPKLVNSSPTKVTNDDCKNFTLPTVKKQQTIMNQTDSFKTSVTRVKQLIPASYCDCLTGAWLWGWLIIAASRLLPTTTKGAGCIASRTASHRDPSWQPSFQHLHLWCIRQRPSNHVCCWILTNSGRNSQQRHGKRKWIPPDLDVTAR